MKATMALGQIGCGYWGPNLLRVFNELPGCRVKWLCELKPGRLEWARQRYPGLGLTADFKDILEDPEIDAVAIATEVVTHFSLAKAALSAGKHVFVEKPLAHSAAEASELAALARRQRRTLGVGHVFLYHPAVRRLKEELGRGGLGRLFYLDMARINPGPPSPRHDVVWDMAPHDVAMAIHLAGKNPSAVRATGWRYTQGRLDEAAFIEIEFGSGVVARIHVGWLSSRRIRRVEIYAERGSAFYDDVEAFEKLRLVRPGKDTRVGADSKKAQSLYYGAGDIEIPALAPEEPLRNECADFLAAARRGVQPLSGPELGVGVVRVLEQACRSTASGGRRMAFKP
ncbi:MAG: Gfo/Idh/MocA family oxidoreductase [Elusimicrobia bacterium]|nr:Gfo/Idh/MocA family oxidoreductase [Elusimicrobiota bacterium]